MEQDHIEFNCPACGKLLRISSASGGQSGRCNFCNAKITAPVGQKQYLAAPSLELMSQKPHERRTVDRSSSGTLIARLQGLPRGALLGSVAFTLLLLALLYCYIEAIAIGTVVGTNRTFLLVALEAGLVLIALFAIQNWRDSRIPPYSLFKEYNPTEDVCAKLSRAIVRTRQRNRHRSLTDLTLGILVILLCATKFVIYDYSSFSSSVFFFFIYVLLIGAVISLGRDDPQRLEDLLLRLSAATSFRRLKEAWSDLDLNPEVSFLADGHIVGVDEVKRTVGIVDADYCGESFCFDRIIDVIMQIDSKTSLGDTRVRKSPSLLTAVLGGLLFGPAGAIVGSQIGATEVHQLSSNTEERYSINLILDSIARSSRVIDFGINKAAAVQCYSTLRVALERKMTSKGSGMPIIEANSLPTL